MLKFSKILVPTDFSERSASAYTHAREIARHFNARVDFMHVIPTLKYFNESLSKLSVPLDMEKDLYPHAQKDAKDKLKGFMDEYISKEHRGDIVVQTGRKPSRAIVEYAGSGGYDLIVMSARGKHGTDLLRGGVTEKVIRHSPVPVFSVDEQFAAGGFNRILVPTDSSLLSFTSFPLAVMLADVYGAEITLLHVVELYGSRIESDSWDQTKTEAENIYEYILTQLQSYLDRHRLDYLAITRAEGKFKDRVVISNGESNKSLPLQTVIERGVTAHAVIEDYATDHADAVVITSHGRSGLTHLLLGSTAEKVVQYVALPVLTVKPEKEELKTE